MLFPLLYSPIPLFLPFTQLKFQGASTGSTPPHADGSPIKFRTTSPKETSSAVCQSHYVTLAPFITNSWGWQYHTFSFPPKPPTFLDLPDVQWIILLPISLRKWKNARTSIHPHHHHLLAPILTPWPPPTSHHHGVDIWAPRAKGQAFYPYSRSHSPAITQSWHIQNFVLWCSQGALKLSLQTWSSYSLSQISKGYKPKTSESSLTPFFLSPKSNLLPNTCQKCMFKMYLLLDYFLPPQLPPALSKPSSLA